MSGVVGFYGKLPGTGDLVRRRLPPDFIDGWDRHFQRAVETGRRELGERWATAWEQGAAWRFVLPPQVCGNRSWCGLTGPAVDRLGRAFPMVLAAPCSGDVAQILCNDAWFDALECVYWSARHEAVSVETFDARVAALPHPLTPASGLAPIWRGLPWDSGQWQLDRRDGAAVGALLSEAWRQSGLRQGPWCLWWTEGAARLLATRGLPRSQAALLDESPPLCSDAAESTHGSCGDPAARGAAGPLSETAQQCDAPPAISSDWLAGDAPRGCAVPQAWRELASGDTCRWLDDGRTLVLSADDGPYDAHRVAARAIRDTLAVSAPDFASQRAALMSLHARLRDARPNTSAAANENGVAIVVRFDGALTRLLRVGAAALWHWRRGHLQAPFIERAAGAGGEFDDLLFGDAWLAMPGIGTVDEADCDEAALRLEPCDRLVLLATRALTQLPRASLAEALALPTCEDVRAHLALLAGLGARPTHWPLAVVEVGA
ncbi:type VI secretion system-associated protein TagF [Paraburkholderia caffeinilytica]|uniref:type VI secretion system-associated protein TagF n=1 Tax=Paraburkholderia caffeinilytica TaxID=1761016 RepID=UPI0038BC0677